MPKPSATSAPDANPEAFREALVQWFQRHGLIYPWRETEDPYAILVSEIMLQQTQIRTVLAGGYYTRWMARFPDFASLATAPEEAVLKGWEGLGYYRRARHLQQLARVVVEEHEGKMPADPAIIRSLPGIGPYTAGALLSFAFHQPAALVDGNVARVLSRLFDDARPVDSSDGIRVFWLRAEQLVSPEDPRAYNSGLMELGQQVCHKSGPECGNCPVAGFCMTRSPETLPVKRARRATVSWDEHTLFAVDKDRLLLCRENGRRRQGLWKLPERAERSSRHGARLLYRAKYSITHYRVTLHVYAPKDPAATARDGELWHRLEEVPELAMASPYRKAVDRLLEQEKQEFRLD